MEMPKGLGIGWRVDKMVEGDSSVRAIADAIQVIPQGGAVVIATVNINAPDWNMVALLGAKMVEMAAQQQSRIVGAPASALKLLK